MNHGVSESKEKAPTWRLALWCVLTAVALLLVVADGWNVAEPPTAPTPPDLFGTEATCTVEGDKALTLAQQRMRRAQLRWERGVFDRATSPLALADARLAKACFERAGERPSATVAADFAQRIEASVARDYRQLQLRLRVALQRGDVEMANDAIDGLRALVGPEEGAYVRWLEGVARSLRAGGDA